MLEVSHLAVDHGQLRALWDVSFRVGEGERVALLGANGAGKSTTLGALLGLYRPAGGTIVYRGQAIGGRDTADNVEDGIALVPEGRRLFPEMTVRENLEMGAYVRSKRAGVSEALERCYALFPVLREKARPAGAPALGRPAADGGDRPRPDVAPEAAAARRAVPRRCPDHHRRGDGALHACRTRASRSCSSSRTFTAPWTSSPAPMSSRTAAPCSKASAQTLLGDPNFTSKFLGLE